MQIAYDRPNNRAFLKWEVDFEQVDRTYVKRFDLQREYELKVVCTKASKCKKFCHRSQMAPTRFGNQTLAAPEFPSPANVTYLGVAEKKVNHKTCHKWKVVEDGQTMYYFEEVSSRQPVRLEMPGMVYDIHEFAAGPVPESRFVLTDAFKKACEPQPNNIGFPQTHVFHHWLRM